MRVFKDLISGDEFFSDSFPHEIVYEQAGIKAKAKWVTKGAEAVNIATDEEEEEVEGETVIDIQDKFQLNEVQGFTKAEFVQWAKAYLPKVKQQLIDNGKEDRVKDFMKGASQMVKFIAGNFGEFQLFVGEKMDYEGAFCFAW